MIENHLNYHTMNSLIVLFIRHDLILRIAMGL